jgi:hypothetical protein
MLLTKLAADVLRTPDSPAAHVAVAAVALAEAIRQRIGVPLDATTLLWVAVQRFPTASWAADATEAIGRLANRSVVQTVVNSITGEGASRELRRMGLDALAAPHAAIQVTDPELLLLVEVAQGRETSHVADVILAASEGRRLDPRTIELVVERWTGQADPHARHAALELVGLLPLNVGSEVVETALLQDPAASVREAAAMMVEDVLDPQARVALLDRALAAEEHRDVRAELERARVEAVAALGNTARAAPP